MIEYGAVGVTVGIGAAIVLGGLAFILVAMRMFRQPGGPAT